MTQTFNCRELFTLPGDAFPVRGTYHRAHNQRSGVRRPKPLGIIFLNSLSLPRAATGDSAVEWADSLAEAGYPCFRVDLPGLGDSAGELPSDLLNFINGGGFAPAVSDIANQIAQRFDLKGVILAGHCAGAVSALLAADRTPECKGLVLMDVYFHLPQAVRSTFRRYLSDWALRSALGRWGSNVYDRLRKIRNRLRADNLPDNANLPLLLCWKQVASNGQPILMLRAPARKAVGTRPRTGEFDYLGYALKTAGPRSRVTVALAEGTDHSFANLPGRTAVRREIGIWLDQYFPSETQSAPPVMATALPVQNLQSQARAAYRN